MIPDHDDHTEPEKDTPKQNEEDKNEGESEDDEPNEPDPGSTTGVVIDHQHYHTDATVDIPDITFTGKETAQDIVDKFNDYYKHHKQRRTELAGDSVSSTAITHSQLLKSRDCRRVFMRRCLIFASLCLWVTKI